MSEGKSEHAPNRGKPHHKKPNPKDQATKTGFIFDPVKRDDVSLFLKQFGQHPVPLKFTKASTTNIFPTRTLYSMFDGECDNERSSPNLDFVIEGLEAPLKLHTNILCCASDLVNGVIKCTEAAAESPAPRARFEWPFELNSEEERDALVQVLKYCYGRALQVGPGDVCAVLATVWRMQLRDARQVSDQLAGYAYHTARSDVAAGASMLLDCVKYEECCNSKCCELDKRLASVVLTQRNMEQHFGEVVGKCLLQLPAHMLDQATYGVPHSRCSEFAVRLMYVKAHHDALSTEDKKRILAKVCETQLNGEEIEQLRQTGLYTDAELLESAISAVKALSLSSNEARARPFTFSFPPGTANKNPNPFAQNSKQNAFSFALNRDQPTQKP